MSDRDRSSLLPLPSDVADVRASSAVDDVDRLDGRNMPSSLLPAFEMELLRETSLDSPYPPFPAWIGVVFLEPKALLVRRAMLLIDGPRESVLSLPAGSGRVVVPPEAIVVLAS